MLVVDAETPPDVEVLQLEPLGVDLLDKVAHDYGGVAEDADLGDGGAQVAVHAHKLDLGGLLLDLVEEPLRGSGRGRWGEEKE